MSTSGRQSFGSCPHGSADEFRMLLTELEKLSDKLGNTIFVGGTKMDNFVDESFVPNSIG